MLHIFDVTIQTNIDYWKSQEFCNRVLTIADYVVVVFFVCRAEMVQLQIF